MHVDNTVAPQASRRGVGSAGPLPQVTKSRCKIRSLPAWPCQWLTSRHQNSVLHVLNGISVFQASWSTAAFRFQVFHAGSTHDAQV
jgi:hypothetical protein